MGFGMQEIIGSPGSGPHPYVGPQRGYDAVTDPAEHGRQIMGNPYMTPVLTDTDDYYRGALDLHLHYTWRRVEACAVLNALSGTDIVRWDMLDSAVRHHQVEHGVTGEAQDDN